ncbi:MAG TPA: hypothetical protein VKR22_10320 [Acidimicrobiales bacterium]|nr:hypothetical protein [Acidimicrobiales bacterium]
MTFVDPASTSDGQAALERILRAYVARRPGWPTEVEPEVRVVETEMVRRGRPGLYDVVAEVGGRIVHVALGLRIGGDDVYFFPSGDDPVLGVLPVDDDRLVAFDALHDAETAALLLEHVTGEQADPALVRPVRYDDESSAVASGDALVFTVYDSLERGPRPGIEMLVALDDEGFNHLPAPLSIWRRGTWDLGLVQEHLPGASTGWALALTSVRDLYASGGPPDMAGGDFGSEAHRLGTMAARMHLALERAFGRRKMEHSQLADALARAVAIRTPMRAERPEVVALLDELRAVTTTGDAIRTHGDLHLGRVWRTEQGWYVGDFAPGGRPPDPGDGSPPLAVVDEQGEAYRLPLADVADMMWSFGHVAASAAAERDPSGVEGLGELADAWVERNRRAFLAGYLGVPGISTLVPAGRDTVRVLIESLELERGSRERS